jgi:hypothetical protein
VLFLVVLFGANISVFQAPVFSWFDFITGYLMIPGLRHPLLEPQVLEQDAGRATT